MGTAYLYSQFREGTLTDYFKDSNKGAYLLQRAIWALEGELDLSLVTDNPYYSIGLEKGTGDANGAYNVFVFNLTDSSGKLIQDQLAWSSDGGGVPIPPTAYLLGAGLLGLVGLRRKFKK